MFFASRSRIADAYTDGVEDAIAVLLARGDRVGGAVHVHSAELEIREKLFGQSFRPIHDEFRA